jgi:transcriptional regulator with PAS, ATPase and Fis domain
LQERKYEPLGSSDPVDADVRVIAASNRDLSKLVEEGRFREDLYYRINVITIELPPLRERREDIPLLIDHFLDYFGSLDSALVCELHPSAMSVLMEYDYPGNVRELRNIIEHACVLSRGSIIEVGDLPQNVRGDDRTDDLRSASLDELEGRFIESVLAKNDWSRTDTARELGIHKTTLWRKMKKLGITPPSSDVA